MDKKRKKYKLNTQSGLTGADVVIALTTILISVGVIAMMYVNFSFTSREAERRARATQIATSIIENMSKLFYDEIESQFESNGVADNSGKINVSPIYNTDIPNGYTVNINIQNYGVDIQKLITITVSYSVDNKPKQVSIEKLFEREDIVDCNEPNFTDIAYQSQLKTASSDTFLLYDSNAQFAGGEKVICPIKYDKSTHNYKVVSGTDKTWYSYSNKLWARILVIPSNLVSTYITNGVVTNTSVLTGDYSYVWIPRFGIKNGSTNIDIFFKYLDTNYAILNNVDYYSINYETSISESTQRTYSFKVTQNSSEVEATGKWCKYSEISQNATVAYYLNNSQYGPMRAY